MSPKKISATCNVYISPLLSSKVYSCQLCVYLCILISLNCFVTLYHWCDNFLIELSRWILCSPQARRASHQQPAKQEVHRRIAHSTKTEYWCVYCLQCVKKVSGLLNFDVVCDLVVASFLRSDQNTKPAAMEMSPIKTPVKYESSDPSGPWLTPRCYTVRSQMIRVN
jgi:hypothetical protein